MTNNELWRRINQLEPGTTLRTVTGQPFIFDRVAADIVHIRVGPNRRPRRLPRAMLEAANELGLRGDALIPSKIRAEGISEFDPAFVVGVLKAVGADRA
jgi:hypothetical protein